MATAARLRITLADIEPSPWREIDAPLSLTLTKLHDAMQAAFLWLNYHLWEFEVGERRYGPVAEYGEFRIYRAAGTRLETLVDKGVNTFWYTYDFGDEWRHRIDVIRTFAAPDDMSLPCFVDGARRAPPEDVGGPFGFADFLGAISNRSHPDHREVLDWHGGPFDPEDIDVETIEAGLGRLAKRRRGKG